MDGQNETATGTEVQTEKDTQSSGKRGGGIEVTGSVSEIKSFTESGVSVVSGLFTNAPTGTVALDTRQVTNRGNNVAQQTENLLRPTITNHFQQEALIEFVQSTSNKWNATEISGHLITPTSRCVDSKTCKIPLSMKGEQLRMMNLAAITDASSGSLYNQGLVGSRGAQAWIVDYMTKNVETWYDVMPFMKMLHCGIYLRGKYEHDKALWRTASDLAIDLRPFSKTTAAPVKTALTFSSAKKSISGVIISLDTYANLMRGNIQLGANMAAYRYPEDNVAIVPIRLENLTATNMCWHAIARLSSRAWMLSKAYTNTYKSTNNNTDEYETKIIEQMGLNLLEGPDSRVMWVVVDATQNQWAGNTLRVSYEELEHDIPIIESNNLNPNPIAVGNLIERVIGMDDTHPENNDEWSTAWNLLLEYYGTPEGVSMARMMCSEVMFKKTIPYIMGSEGDDEVNKMSSFTGDMLYATDKPKGVQMLGVSAGTNELKAKTAWTSFKAGWEKQVDTWLSPMHLGPTVSWKLAVTETQRSFKEIGDEVTALIAEIAKQPEPQKSDDDVEEEEIDWDDLMKKLKTKPESTHVVDKTDKDLLENDLQKSIEQMRGKYNILKAEKVEIDKEIVKQKADMKTLVTSAKSLTDKTSRKSKNNQQKIKALMIIMSGNITAREAESKKHGDQLAEWSESIKEQVNKSRAGTTYTIKNSKKQNGITVYESSVRTRIGMVAGLVELRTSEIDKNIYYIRADNAMIDLKNLATLLSSETIWVMEYFGIELGNWTGYKENRDEADIKNLAARLVKMMTIGMINTAGVGDILINPHLKGKTGKPIWDGESGGLNRLTLVPRWMKQAWDEKLGVVWKWSENGKWIKSVRVVTEARKMIYMGPTQNKVAPWNLTMDMFNSINVVSTNPKCIATNSYNGSVSRQLIGLHPNELIDIYLENYKSTLAPNLTGARYEQMMVLVGNHNGITRHTNDFSLLMSGGLQNGIYTELKNTQVLLITVDPWEGWLKDTLKGAFEGFIGGAPAGWVGALSGAFIGATTPWIKKGVEWVVDKFGLEDSNG